MSRVLFVVPPYDCWGVQVIGTWPPLQSIRYHLPRMYERIVKVIQVIGAGGLLINPTRDDLLSEIGPDIAAYYRGAGIDAL